MLQSDGSAYRQVAAWPLRDAPRVDVTGIGISPMGNVYLLCRSGPPVRVFGAEGAPLAVWGEGVFVRPHGITVGPDDTVYVVDDAGHTVCVLTPDGRLVRTLGTPGHPSDSGCRGRDYRTVQRGAPPFNFPTCLAVAPGGDLYVTDGYGSARVHRFTGDGRLVHSWGEPGEGPGQFNLPHGVAVAPDGRVYVADRENNRLQVFTEAGAFLGAWAGLGRPSGVFMDGRGHVFVSELGPKPPAPGASRVSVFDLEGRLLGRFGELLAAHAIAGDQSGGIYVGEVPWTVYKGASPADCRAVRKFAPHVQR